MGLRVPSAAPDAGGPDDGLALVRRFLGAAGRDLAPGAEEEAREALAEGEPPADLAARFRRDPAATVALSSGSAEAAAGAGQPILPGMPVAPGEGIRNPSFMRGGAGAGESSSELAGSVPRPSLRESFMTGGPSPAAPLAGVVGPALDSGAPPDRLAAEDRIHGGGGGGETPATPPAASPPQAAAAAPPSQAPGGFRTSAHETGSVGGPLRPADAAAAMSSVQRAATPQSMLDNLAAVQREGADMAHSLGQTGESPEYLKSNLDLWEGKRDKIWDLYKENRERLDWGQAADVFGQLVVQWMAGMQGLRTGVDMTGVKFRPDDWSRKYDQLLATAKTELSDMQERQGFEQKSIDETNRRIEDWRKRREGERETVAGFEGKSALEETAAKNKVVEDAANRASAERQAMTHAGATVQAAIIRANSLEDRMAARPDRLGEAERRDAYREADTKLSKFNEGFQGFDASGLLSKDKDVKAKAVASLQKMAAASDDPKLQAAADAYTGAANAGPLDRAKMWWDDKDPKADFLKAAGAARADLTQRRSSAEQAYRGGGAPAASGPSGASTGPAAPPDGPANTPTEGSTATSRGKPIVFRGGRWVPDNSRPGG